VPQGGKKTKALMQRQQIVEVLDCQSYKGGEDAIWFD